MVTFHPTLVPLCPAANPVWTPIDVLCTSLRCTRGSEAYDGRSVTGSIKRCDRDSTTRHGSSTSPRAGVITEDAEDPMYGLRISACLVSKCCCPTPPAFAHPVIARACAGACSASTVASKALLAPSPRSRASSLRHDAGRFPGHNLALREGSRMKMLDDAHCCCGREARGRLRFRRNQNMRDRTEVISGSWCVVDAPNVI